MSRDCNVRIPLFNPRFFLPPSDTIHPLRKRRTAGACVVGMWTARRQKKRESPYGIPGNRDDQ
jgi:hypothetical protein